MSFALTEQYEPAPFIGAPPTIATPVTVDDRNYEVLLARTQSEIDAALRLRFEVFNLELSEGLDSSFRTGRDRDEFDDTCEHLIAIDRSSGQVVGTYRLRTIEQARTAEGFYSFAEFDLGSMPRWMMDQSVELGRACIARSHRNRRVLFLLWKGLAQYAAARQKRFLFGCCSLNSQDPQDGIDLLQQFTDAGHLHPTLILPVQPDFACRSEVNALPDPSVEIPRLLSAYLGMGAKVCSPPAIDRRFKTIDFLIHFDTRSRHPRARRIFGKG
ncbi:MAG: GNAT family N-acyltransferase [Pyrinomonadaceae bacterium]